ncbi:hypothetical protein FRC01_003419 [Tulasnella sp. 417]|nr:hypothetical protein FRC01_003419 [Tulasnella sp. 417]
MTNSSRASTHQPRRFALGKATSAASWPKRGFNFNHSLHDDHRLPTSTSGFVVGRYSTLPSLKPIMSTSRTPDTALTKFLTAMSSIYGPFPTQGDDLSAWTPPPMAEGHRGRYLWTDAFAVVNFLTLYRLTSNPLYLELGKRLIATVHDTLGRTRDLSARLPGATDSNPLLGGLRIGKVDEEDDPEGDGDGQYFHYLTIWMFALNRTAVVTGDTWYNDQAMELARSWAKAITRKAMACLRRLVDDKSYFERPTSRRLAFREFGTAMGVRCLGHLAREWEIGHLADDIAREWEMSGLVPEPTPEKKKAMQGSRLAELMPITQVMYASALVPGVFKKIGL